MESEWLSYGAKNKPESDHCPNFFGLYGWRRKCLQFTLFILILIVSINIALSLWILKILQFSQNGIGRLHIHPGGVKLSGEAVAIGKLVASKLESRKSESINFESSRNITLVSRNFGSSQVGSRLILGGSKLEVIAKSMRVVDTRGRLLFLGESNQVQVGAEVFRVTGDGGAVLQGSLQTPTVRAESGQPVKLESPTRSLNVFALNEVNIESRAGDITATCFKDIKLESKTNSVKLDVQNVFLPRVPAAVLTEIERLARASFGPLPAVPNDPKRQKVFQVCICEKGRLFLAPPEGPCVADNDVCR